MVFLNTDVVTTHNLHSTKKNLTVIFNVMSPTSSRNITFYKHYVFFTFCIPFHAFSKSKIKHVPYVKMVKTCSHTFLIIQNVGWCYHYTRMQVIFETNSKLYYLKALNMYCILFNQFKAGWKCFVYSLAN